VGSIPTALTRLLKHLDPFRTNRTPCYGHCVGKWDGADVHVGAVSVVFCRMGSREPFANRSRDRNHGTVGLPQADKVVPPRRSYRRLPSNHRLGNRRSRSGARASML
jgi:hypothetical protein